LVEQICDFGQYRPSGDQAAGEGAGELDCSLVIRVAGVDQSEYGTGVSEDVSRQQSDEPGPWPSPPSCAV
jgi:hypothetical protein